MGKARGGELVELSHPDSSLDRPRYSPWYKWSAHNPQESLVRLPKELSLRDSDASSLSDVQLEEDPSIPSGGGGSGADASVTLSDQNAINAFSRHNSRTDEIIDELETLSKVKEDYEEIETELELLDEDEQIMSVRFPLPVPSLSKIFDGFPTACRQVQTRLDVPAFARFRSARALADKLGQDAGKSRKARAREGDVPRRDGEAEKSLVRKVWK